VPQALGKERVSGSGGGYLPAATVVAGREQHLLARAAWCCAAAGLASCAHPLLRAILCFVPRQRWRRPVLGCGNPGRLLVACFQVVGAKRKPCCLADDDDVLWALFPSLEASVVAPSFLPSADLQGENLVPATQAAEELHASQPSLEALPPQVLCVVVVAVSSSWR